MTEECGCVLCSSRSSGTAPLDERLVPRRSFYDRKGKFDRIGWLAETLERQKHQEEERERELRQQRLLTWKPGGVTSVPRNVYEVDKSKLACDLPAPHVLRHMVEHGLGYLVVPHPREEVHYWLPVEKIIDHLTGRREPANRFEFNLADAVPN